MDSAVSCTRKEKQICIMRVLESFTVATNVFTGMDAKRQVEEEEKNGLASLLNEALMALMWGSTISFPSLTFNEPINEATTADKTCSHTHMLY